MHNAENSKVPACPGLVAYAGMICTTSRNPSCSESGLPEHPAQAFLCPPSHLCLLLSHQVSFQALFPSVLILTAILCGTSEDFPALAHVVLGMAGNMGELPCWCQERGCKIQKKAVKGGGRDPAMKDLTSNGRVPRVSDNICESLSTTAKENYKVWTSPEMGVLMKILHILPHATGAYPLAAISREHRPQSHLCFRLTL